MRPQNNNNKATRRLTRISASLQKAIDRIKTGRAPLPKQKTVVVAKVPHVRRERDEANLKTA